jgi:hypothetical protein
VLANDFSPLPPAPDACSYIFAYYMFGQEMFADDFSPGANAINQALFEDKQVGTQCTAVGDPPAAVCLLLAACCC